MTFFVACDAAASRGGAFPVAYFELQGGSTPQRGRVPGTLRLDPLRPEAPVQHQQSRGEMFTTTPTYCILGAVNVLRR